jgi:predicted permease
MTAGLVFSFTKLNHRTSDGTIALLLLFYLATVTMWMVGSFSLARAKGYSSDMMGAVFIFLFILGFCFPVAPFVFPAVVVFGLKDKTRERLRRF